MTIEQCRAMNCAHVSDTRNVRNCGFVDCSSYPSAFEECFFEKEEFNFYEIEEESCEGGGVELEERTYTGTFNIRISPDLHRTIATYAIEHGKSLNAAVEEAIEHMVG